VIESGAGKAGGRLVPVARRRSRRIGLLIEGERVDACDGESLLCAILRHRSDLRRLESNGEPRAGFCLMGACQDCWVWLGDGARVRACTTPAADGMDVRLFAPSGYPRHA
jgi:D-hydroxyproline dehydrogenase subunit gamma